MKKHVLSLALVLVLALALVPTVSAAGYTQITKGEWSGYSFEFKIPNFIGEIDGIWAGEGADGGRVIFAEEPVSVDVVLLDSDDVLFVPELSMTDLTGASFGTKNAEIIYRIFRGSPNAEVSGKDFNPQYLTFAMRDGFTMEDVGGTNEEFKNSTIALKGASYMQSTWGTEYLWSYSILVSDDSGDIGGGYGYVILLTPSLADKVVATGVFDGVEFPALKELILAARGDTTPAPTPSSWAAEYVDRAKALGILPTAFQSNYTDNITRAEACALVVALYETATDKEITERKQFVDTTDINVQKVGALGIVTGIGNDKFDPNGTLTREQSAVILARLAEKMGKKLPSAKSTFSDSSKMSSWAVGAIGQMQQSGIMSGVGNNNFNPNGSYTREQSIITMVRIWDLIKE